MKIALTAFTSRGTGLARSLAHDLAEIGHSCALAVPERLSPETGLPGYGSLGEWAGARFADTDALLFVGASGIAVRANLPTPPWCRWTRRDTSSSPSSPAMWGAPTTWPGWWHGSPEALRRCPPPPM